MERSSNGNMPESNFGERAVPMFNEVAVKELLEAKQQINSQKDMISRLQVEIKDLVLEVQELQENKLEINGNRSRRSLDNTNKTTALELQTKLQHQEKKNCQLEIENAELTSNVRNLTQEIEEVKDSFREDSGLDEYTRYLKKELMIEAKNCRTLQFKLKKAEKSIHGIATTADANRAEPDGVASTLDIMNQIKQLNTDNILIINSILNKKKISGI